MIALTVDQRGSRDAGDRIASWLTALADDPEVRLTLPFARTAGDEMQALADDPTGVTAAVRRLVRDGGWWIGIGVGEVEQPLPDDVRAARGPALVRARGAVEQAKGRPSGVAVEA